MPSLSDHKIAVIELDLSCQRRTVQPTKYWKLNSSIMRAEELNAAILQVLDELDYTNMVEVIKPRIIDMVRTYLRL